MANGRNKSRKGNSGRDAGGFSALPWSVLDCPAYAGLSHCARALLLEFARQFVNNNNGRLLATGAHLAKRGWYSAGAVHKAKQELLEAGFIFETVKGQRPNRASWYAITWQALDRLPGYDEGTWETFERSAYRAAPGKDKRPAPKCKRPKKNASLIPPHGVDEALIAPPHGVDGLSVAPPHGTMRPPLKTRSTPPHGNHLEMPSTAALETALHGAMQPEKLEKQIGPLARKLALVNASCVETVRVRDHDLDPVLYDEVIGEHCPRPQVSARSQRQAADAWVDGALQQKGRAAQ